MAHKRTIEGMKFNAGKKPPKKSSKGPKTPFGIPSGMKSAFPKAPSKSQKGRIFPHGKLPPKRKK